jgi:hypothetical protein
MLGFGAVGWPGTEVLWWALQDAFWFSLAVRSCF